MRLVLFIAVVFENELLSRVVNIDLNLKFINTGQESKARVLICVTSAGKMTVVNNCEP